MKISKKIKELIGDVPNMSSLVIDSTLADLSVEVEKLEIEKYDSKADTLLHIKRVSELLSMAAVELLSRARVHDDSKLESPEKELFDKYTPMLKELTYGSQEYKICLKDLGVALQHHYKNNSHHPEHYTNGINGMNLFDIIEMFFDWKAAGERHEDGDINKSIEINKKRFEMSDQLAYIFQNTVLHLEGGIVFESSNN